MDNHITYGNAIREALDQAMEKNESVVVFGLDVDDPKRILGTTNNLLEKYGPDRVFGTPLSEDAMTGVAIGMATAGLRPVHVHIRNYFLMLAMNQLVNMASKASYMTGGQLSVPLVVRSIIGKSWGQGAQHSQALYSMLMHVPGLKVIAPTTPYDVKGGMLTAIEDNNPVIFVEHRLLYYQKGIVPQNYYTIEEGNARITHHGDDVTVVGISYMQIECLKARLYLESKGISAEIIDPIWLDPLDIGKIVGSARKTGKLCVVENGWLSCGAASEIICQALEIVQGEFQLKVHRIGFAPVVCPPSPPLEKQFYPNARTIASEVYNFVEGGNEKWFPEENIDISDIEFKGPF